MDRNLLLALTLSATFQCLAQTPEPFEVRRAEPVFEELPELKASEILKPELLKGPHYVVRDPVPTASGMNQFTIDSDFGVFEADGNEMLLQRLKEIDAIARLQEVSRTDEFKKSLVAAAQSPLNSAKNIARDPAQAISNVPKGIMKFLGHAKETVENVGKGGNDDAGEGSRMKDALGYSDKKTKDRAPDGDRSIQQQHRPAKGAGRRRLGFVGRWIHLQCRHFSNQWPDRSGTYGDQS